MTKEQSANLVRKAQHGSRDAFEELIRAKQRQILFVSYTKLGNMQDAEEVTQESIIAVFRHIGGLKKPESFDAWLNRIIIGNCHKHLRKYGVLKTESDADDAALDITEEAADFIPEEYAEKEELRREVYEIVMSLPETRRDTIFMYYYEDMSLKEIAEATGVAEATAASNISRARQMIKDKLGEPKQEERPLYGAASTMTLGRILQSAAAEIVPDSQLSIVEKNWTEATRAMKFTPKKVPKVNNFTTIVTCSVLVTSVLSAAVILHNGSDGESAATQPVVTQSADAEKREIIFSGSDCDCGHINPGSVAIDSPQEGDTELLWTIRNSETGETVFSGNTKATNATLAALSGQKEDGRYVIQCVFSDIGNHTIALDRSFIIGNYHSDSENPDD
ncbi:MAG: RNA polymerase sigma factor [Clostridiales Family XIII bacterium]|jgi:RNA polymerase sigma-70 factor (ECF subfamily)|nr:RNA polymerase sigma factor [Clostridiales Family XIII bacterium]